MRTLKTSRRELEHVAVCVTGEVSAEFIRDIQETMRRENQRRRDAVGLAGHSENIFLQSVSTSAVGLMGSMITEIVGSLALTAYTGE
jgi:hypothetical protein